MSKIILKQKGRPSEEAEARNEFQVGKELYGYCLGIFGRSYGTKVVESIGEYSICVAENESILYGQVDSWVELLKSSNESLEQEELEDERKA